MGGGKFKNYAFKVEGSTSNKKDEYAGMFLRDAKGVWRAAVIATHFKHANDIGGIPSAHKKGRYLIDDATLKWMRGEGIFRGGVAPYVLTLSSLCKCFSEEKIALKRLATTVLDEAANHNITLHKDDLDALTASVAPDEEVERAALRPIRKRASPNRSEEEEAAQRQPVKKASAAVQASVAAGVPVALPQDLQSMLAAFTEHYVEAHKEAWRTQFIEENKATLKKEYFHRLDNIIANVAAESE